VTCGNVAHRFAFSRCLAASGCTAVDREIP
jgi:hypothetical protein